MRDTIELAREAGIKWDLIDEDEGRVWYITQAGLERFAEIVRADAHRTPLTDKEITAHWDKAGESGQTFIGFARAIEAAHNIKENT